MENRITEINILSHRVNYCRDEDRILDGVDTKHSYIALIKGKYHRGRFSSVWFGFNFHSPGFAHYGCGCVQYDPPNENGSDWQRLWRIEDPTIPKWMSGDAILMMCGLDPVKIRADEEMPMAIRQRNHSIKHHCVYRGKTIDETSPIEAWLYDSEIPSMPGPYQSDDDEDD